MGAPAFTDGLALNDKEAVWITPPLLVAGPDVEKAVWSSDGQYLLVLQRRMRLSSGQWRGVLRAAAKRERMPPGDLVVGVWRRSTARHSEVLKLRLDQAMVADLAWMPQSSSALAKVTRFETPITAGDVPAIATQLYRIDAAAARADAVCDPLQEADTNFHLSPSKPLAVFQTSPTRAVFIGVSGRPVPVAIPEGVAVSEVRWTSGGAVPYIVTGGPAPRFYLISTSGDVSPLGKEPKPDPPGERQPAHLNLSTGTPISNNGLPLSSRPLWLTPGRVGSADACKALVSADAECETLSPAADAVCYVSSGAAFVRDIVRMPLGEYEAVEVARRAAIQAHITNQAKQAAIAMIMYATDHEEVLPGSQTGLSGELEPYLRGDAAQGILEGLAYTYQGRTLSDAKDPSSTELGYIPGPSGRAVLYVDGHVEWRDGEAPPR